MSILTLLCPPSLSSRINTSRATLLALVHDIAESLVGDLTPLDNVPKAEKHRREELTIEYLTSSKLLPPFLASTAGTTIREAWHEYEENETLEAKYVHDIDKLELLLQMVEYERRERGRVDLGEFVWVSEQVRLEEMKAWCEDVLKEREEFWRGLWKELQEEEAAAGEQGNQPDGVEAGEGGEVPRKSQADGDENAGEKPQQNPKNRKEIAQKALTDIESQKHQDRKKQPNTNTPNNSNTKAAEVVVNGITSNEPPQTSTEKANPSPKKEESQRPKTPKTPSKKDTIAMEFAKYGSPDKPRKGKEHR
ncbi:MAG: hypothetical protein Q9183_007518 [Haloplaca sp. 2 TL-2023]